MRCWIDSAGRRRTCDSVPCKARPSMHGPVYVNVYPAMSFTFTFTSATSPSADQAYAR